MERKYLSNLIEWMNDKERKPLMIFGARQVGKSYLVEELFAKKYYKDRYLKIDLSNEIDFVKYVETNNNLEKALDYIELHYNFIADKNHLLFFDEAQECPAIIQMMKHFCEKRRDIPVIVTGSLVRLRLNRDSKKNKKSFLYPVGKINQLYMYPLTFDEFLMNYDKYKYEYIKNHFENKIQIDDIIHKELIDVFKNYMFIGGMPEIVDTFIKHKDERINSFRLVQSKHKEIYDDYLSDMALYQMSTESMIRSRLIYGDIFKQLNKENKNFKISNTIKGSKNRDMINPYFWLKTAGVILQSHCLKEIITTPLIKDEDSLFRLYLSDVGMFAYQSKLNYDSFLKDKNNSLSGIYYENYVATELVARGYNLFYWKGKRNSEFEFIIEIKGNIIPIDIKKSRGSLNSLIEFRTHNKKNIVLKVSSNKYGYDKNNEILTLPFYYLPFYLDSIEKGTINIDDNNL